VMLNQQQEKKIAVAGLREEEHLKKFKDRPPAGPDLGAFHEEQRKQLTLDWS
jgi:hypothetical protein